MIQPESNGDKSSSNKVFLEKLVVAFVVLIYVAIFVKVLFL